MERRKELFVYFLIPHGRGKHSVKLIDSKELLDLVGIPLISLLLSCDKTLYRAMGRKQDTHCQYGEPTSGRTDKN